MSNKAQRDRILAIRRILRQREDLGGHVLYQDLLWLSMLALQMSTGIGEVTMKLELVKSRLDELLEDG